MCAVVPGIRAVTSTVEGAAAMPENELSSVPDDTAEVDPDNQADVAEEFAENAGIDPSPHEVDEYVALQDSDPA
ncbi:hypothetical protein GCM10009539_53580 [Cryptosporangium japonicum]|uniref:Uncharacterized protein n=2 Tax=Cryptosporangium japonicum TaxID=80872 RepID=A0ABN0UTT9_9ACTN